MVNPAKASYRNSTPLPPRTGKRLGRCIDVDVEVGLARTRGGEHLTELSKRQRFHRKVAGIRQSEVRNPKNGLCGGGLSEARADSGHSVSTVDCNDE